MHSHQVGHFSQVFCDWNIASTESVVCLLSYHKLLVKPLWSNLYC